eukprot:3310279-Prymnesium_polylepis.1
MAKTLIALGADLTGHSNPCGRGVHGTPLELARGGGHHKIAEIIVAALNGQTSAAPAPAGPLPTPLVVPAGELALNFTHVSNGAFDGKGVLCAIGSNWGTAAYVNPADSGKVGVG